MAEITTKDVLTLEELKNLTGQAAKAAVIYDTSTGEPSGLDVEIFINMDASIGVVDASVQALEQQASDLSQGKADKVSGATTGNFAALDASGNLVDSLTKPSDFEGVDESILRQADVVDSLTSDSTTTPLSAKQGKKLQDEKEALANKSTDIVADAESTTKYPSVKLIKDYADSLHPELALYTRWLADTGTQLDEELLLKVYADYLNNLPETEFLFCPQIASKNRTDGVNQYINTLYDLGEDENDAVQTTEATQPYLGGYIAPNENRYLKFVSGQTQTGLLDFTDVVFAATDSWTLNLTVKANNLGRIYLGSAYISIGASSIILHNGTDAVLTGTISTEVGKAYIFEFQYANGAGLIKANNIPLVTVAASKAVTFGQVSYNSSFPFDGAVYFAHLTNTRKSESDSQKEYTILRSVFPEIESIAIGNQVWATSNFEGVVAGGGTVIPEVKGATTDGNAELIPLLDFTTSDWTKVNTPTITSNSFTTNASGGCIYTPIAARMIIGKCYNLVAEFTSNVNWAVVNGQSGGEIFVSGSGGTISLSTYIKPAQGSYGTIYIRLASAGTITFTLISLKEVGWTDATTVYDSVYAATSGTAAVKDLAATKAAAMCCYYDNSAANGAVYGRLYNWYAVHLFDLLPPVKGWRIGGYNDWKQLRDFIGDLNHLQHNMSNQTGFSALRAGQRGTIGTFSQIGAFSRIWHSTSFSGTEAYLYQWLLGDNNSFAVYLDKIFAFPTRLLRNSPSGENELSYTSGLFTTDITSAAKQIAVSFGRSIDYIRIKSENALTAVEAKLHNSAGTAVATLITGKSVSAGATMVFPVSSDYAALLQDGTVRVTASGNSGAAVGMEIQVLTHKSVL